MFAKPQPSTQDDQSLNQNPLNTSTTDSGHAPVDRATAEFPLDTGSGVDVARVTHAQNSQHDNNPDGEATRTRKPLALVVDDRQLHLDLTARALEREGYQVKTAMSLQEAKEVVLTQKENGGFDRIVSDYDYGSTLLQKHRMFDGFRFLKWCVEDQGMDPATLTLHSTVFEPWQHLGRFFHDTLFRVIPRTEALGIAVQPKSALIGNSIYKGRGTSS